MGLHTDDSPSAIPPTAVIVANDVGMFNNMIEKFGGSKPLNLTPVPGGIFAGLDWWPNANPANQRFIMLGGDGKTYAMDSAFAITEVTPNGGAPVSLTANQQTFMVTGNSEGGSSTRKIFLFTGADPVQIIAGTNATRTNIALPPADWAGTNQPSAGVIFRGELYAWGNANHPHTVYVSSATNHEDFTTTPRSILVYPGEGERIVGSMIYKGRFLLFKYPNGVYYLDDTDATPANWFFVKSAENFGVPGPHSIVSALNDLLIKNQTNSITSLVATLNFGGTQAGDMLTILRIEQYIRDNTNPAAAGSTHSIYYAEKKLAMFTYRSPLSASNDLILTFRLDVSGMPKATFLKQTWNLIGTGPNILALRKDASLIERPVYGALDGFLYLMDQPNYNVNGVSYIGEFQTPQLDFGFMDPKMAGRNKNFDFLELRYVPEGDWSIFADIFIDGNYTETVEFSMSGFKLLADDTNTPQDFILATDNLDPTGSFLADDSLLTVRKRIRGTGRTISVRFYNNGLDQNFKIATMIFSFRMSGEQQH